MFLAVLTDFFRGGQQAEEHHHPTGKLHHRGHQEGVLNTATHYVNFWFLRIGIVKCVALEFIYLCTCYWF